MAILNKVNSRNFANILKIICNILSELEYHEEAIKIF
jgi:hypothetical protein